ncbi:MAG: KpsF/GutQ family sugar-phosphate isomerase [Desulfovibrionaceae bacterium]
MIQYNSYLQDGQDVISSNICSLQNLILDENFVKALSLLDNIGGNIFFLGLGKSGIIASKLAATFASFGFKAFFLHPTEALHGDIGRMQRGDITIAISNSGSTVELLDVIPTIKSRAIPLISITAKTSSPLGKMSDASLSSYVDKEACPWNIVPTTSLVAATVLGDALAICLAKIKKRTQNDFAMHHPKGALGERLLQSVKSIMHTENIPTINRDNIFLEAVKTIDSGGIGVVYVVDDNEVLCGIITDGDIRRHVLKDGSAQENIDSAMKKNPITGTINISVAEILDIMEKYAITSMPIITEEQKIIGVVHLHDILGRGKIQYS